MSLNADDITNLERGIDAALDTILGMAQRSMATITVRHGAELAGPFIGFLQALVENRHALTLKSLDAAMVAHPDLIKDGDADV